MRYQRNKRWVNDESDMTAEDMNNIEDFLESLNTKVETEQVKVYDETGRGGYVDISLGGVEATDMIVSRNDVVGGGVSLKGIPGTIEETANELKAEITKVKATTPSKTGVSPLAPCVNAPILSLTAKGASRQETEQTIVAVQGTFNGTVGQPINASVIASTTRCCTNVFALKKGDKISITNGFLAYVAKATTEDGNIENTSGWVSEYTAPSDGFYRVGIMKSGDGAITPSSFSLTAIVSPTPSNPIPIVDASGVVTARTANLCKRLEVGKNWNDGNFATTGFYEAEVEAGKEFTVSYNNNDGISYVKVFTFTADSVASYTSLYNFPMNANTKYTAIMPAGSSRVRVLVGSSATMTEALMKSKEVQVEIGSNATAYTLPMENSITLPYTIKSVGNVKDELIVNADGTGEYIQNVYTELINGSTMDFREHSSGRGYAQFTPTKEIDISSGDSTITGISDMFKGIIAKNWSVEDAFVCTYTTSTKGFVAAPMSMTKADFQSLMSGKRFVFQYILANPLHVPLTADQVADILKLSTYKGTTVIDAELDTEVGYAVDIIEYVDSKTNYSYTERKIGKWADDSDLYQMVIQTTTPNAVGTATKIANLDGTKYDVKNYYGTIESQANSKIPINFYFNSSIFVTTYVDADGVKMMNAYNGYANKPCEIVVEYTKKGEEPAALSIDEEEES